MLSVLWSRLITWLLPWYISKTKQNDWLNATLKPLKEVYADFMTWKDVKIFEVSISGQVISLEKMLNKVFNNDIAAWTWDATNYIYIPNAVTGIYIVDYPNALPVIYLWNELELRPSLYIYNISEAHNPATYLYNKSEYDNQADFNVMIPIGICNITTDMVLVARIKAMINQYRQAGARYHLVNY